MEDTVVLKQHYIYMFRLDIIYVENHTPQSHVLYNTLKNTTSVIG